MTLGHGDPHDADGPQVRVATKETADLAIELRFTAQELVHSLWDDGVEHTEAVRAPFTAEDPTSGWDDVDLDVDRSSVRFKMLRSTRSWVAFAAVEGYVVTVHSHNVEPEDVELSRLVELQAYRDADAFPWKNWPDQ